MKKYVSMITLAFVLLCTSACGIKDIMSKIPNIDIKNITSESKKSDNKLLGEWYYCDGSGPIRKSDYERIEIKQVDENTLEIWWENGNVDKLNIFSDTAATMETELDIVGKKETVVYTYRYFYDYGRENLECVLTYKKNGEMIGNPGVGGCRKEGLDQMYGYFSDKQDMNPEEVEGYLSCKYSFIDFETGEEATFDNLSIINDSYVGRPCRYAVCDLDGDGVNELLIEYDQMGDTAILHTNGSVCTAYYMPYRGRIDVKTDGTMNWSNGGGTSGTKKVFFSEKGLNSKDIIVMDYTMELFEVNNKKVTEKECQDASSAQYNKPNVEWININ